MTDIARTSFSFPAIRSKKATGSFDGGAITSDAGVLLLVQAERRPGIVDCLAGVIPDDRDPSRVRHRVCDILRARAMAVACGYEDADDLDALRHDPRFMMALGKAPGEEVGLVSQPTMSRFENRANVRSLIHIGRERVDIFGSVYKLYAFTVCSFCNQREVSPWIIRAPLKIALFPVLCYTLGIGLVWG